MKKILSLFLGFMLLMSPIFMTTAKAESNSWDFDTTNNYSLSDSSETEISNGIVILKKNMDPVAKGSISDSSRITFDEPRGIAISGNYAYIVDASTNKKINVVDISDASNPTVVNSIVDNEKMALNGSDDIVISGNYAYIASKEGVEILDISDYSSLEHVGAIFDDDNSYMESCIGIAKSGKYLYVVSGFSENGFSIIDVDDPSNPVLLSSISDDDITLMNGATDVLVNGNYAYVTSYYDNGVEILDITDKSNPTHVGSISDDSNTYMRTLTSIAKKDDYIYVTSRYDNTLTCLDASDPVNLTHVDYIGDGAGMELYEAYNIDFYGDYAIVTGHYDNGVEVVDISDPTDLKHAGAIGNNPANNVYLDYTNDVVVNGNYAYVTANNSFQILDISGEYFKSYPYVNPYNSHSFSETVTSFTETLGSGNQGNVTYQISTNNGGTWYYLNNGAWMTTTATDGSNTSSASEINSKISALDFNGGHFMFRAYLKSDGNQKVELDKVSITYDDLVPELTGVSVNRSASSIARVWINANTRGQIRYLITRTATKPEVSAFDNAGYYDAYSAGTNDFIVNGIPYGNVYLHMMLRTGDDDSEIMTIHMPYNIFYFHDFESYDIDSFPGSFDRVYGGTGSDNQKIINDDGNKVFRMEGANNWQAENKINILEGTTGTLVLSAKVKPVSGSSPVSIGFRSDLSEGNEIIARASFSNNYLVYQSSSSGGMKIFNYSFNQWYELTVVYDIDEKLYSVLLDGVPIHDEPFRDYSSKPLGYIEIATGSTNVNEAYFDDIALYQIPDEITITYNGNGSTGGSVPVDSNTYSYKEEVIVKDNSGTLVRPGFEFDGWNTTSDYSGIHYAAGDKFDAEYNMNLYAQWKGSTYKVTYSPNNATSGSVPTDTGVYKYEDPVTVKINSGNLERTDYTFEGWNTKADGSGTHYDSEDVFDIKGNTLLYAEWKSVITVTPTPTPVVSTPAPSITPSLIADDSSKNILIKDINVVNKKIQLIVGETAEVKYTVDPENATDKSLTWSSLNENVATVNNGKVNAHEIGFTIVKVAVNETVSETIVVEVVDKDAETSVNQKGYLKGVLTDTTGNELEGYTITLYSVPVKDVTDINGCFEFDDVTFTNHTLLVNDSDGKEVGRFDISMDESANAEIVVNNGNKSASIDYSDKTVGIELILAVNGTKEDAEITDSIIEEKEDVTETAEPVEEISETDNQTDTSNWLFYISGLIIIAVIVIVVIRKNRKAE